MSKIDLKKELNKLYSSSLKEVAAVNVPPLNFLMIDGQGDPNTSQEFKDAVETLYAVSYTLKFMAKKSPRANDYVVMPLEGLWCSDDFSDFDLSRKDRWPWTTPASSRLA